MIAARPGLVGDLGAAADALALRLLFVLADLMLAVLILGILGLGVATPSVG